MLSAVKPIALSSSRQAMPAAPAPLHTSLVVLMSRPVRSSALIKPAAAMIAVPCWSSWNTGMSRSSRSRCSMTKHSGARMSSRLIPPQLLPSSLTQLTISSGSSDDLRGRSESMSAKRLNRPPCLPSPACRPARRDFRAEDGRAVGDDGDEIAFGGVVVGAILGSAIASTGTATPGE